MQFKKIFEVAEVCHNVLRVIKHTSYCLAETIRKRSWCAHLRIRGLTRYETQVLTRLGTLRFVYDGERLSPTDTPAEVCYPLLSLLVVLTRTSWQCLAVDGGWRRDRRAPTTGTYSYFFSASPLTCFMIAWRLLSPLLMIYSIVVEHLFHPTSLSCPIVPFVL
jgi:hypothetical protein